MITFFSILLVLIAINAVLMIFSLSSVDSKGIKTEKGMINKMISKIYRMNFSSSKYKKVV